MKAVSMNNHDFHKQNLVTTPKGDLYECSICKAKGYRMGFSENILLTDAMAKKAESCDPPNPNTKIIKIGDLLQMTSPNKKEIPVRRRAKRVLTFRVPVEGGVDEGVHDVVDCPKEYLNKHANDIWVMSKKNVPVRVMPHEIVDYEY